MNRKIVFKPFTIFFVVTLTLCIIATASWAGDGAVVLHSPHYPYRVMIWGDDEGSGLTVAVALKENFGVGSDNLTLDDAVEILLPASAMHFTPEPYYPDSFKAKGVDVPVVVYNLPFMDVFWKYYYWEEDEIEEGDIEAIGIVKVHWSGKAFKSLSFSAIGPVENWTDGEEALLVATGHELYELYEDEYIITFHYKVDLHY